MTDHETEEQFVKALEQQLRVEAEQLPEDARIRLRSMRAQAIAGQPKRRWQDFALPAVGFATTAAVIALAIMLNFSGNGSIPSLPVVDGAELAVVQDLELLEQLEFLAWLEEGGPNAG